MRIVRRIGEIDQDMAQIRYALAHPEEADTPDTYYRMLDPVSSRYRYTLNNPARVVTDPSHASNLLSMEVLSRADMERTLASLFEEQTSLRSQIVRNRETSEQNRTREQEAKTAEGTNLREALVQARSAGSDRIYELDGRYHGVNPRRVLTDPTTATDTLRVHEITLENGDRRLDGMDLPTTRETWLATLDSTIDHLTANTGENLDEKHPYRDNVRRYLISLRLGVSGLSTPSGQ